MAKATLCFVLPDESEEFAAALNGGKLKAALWDLDAHLRNRIKHEQLSATVRDALQHTRDELRGVLREYGLSLDD